MTKQLYVFDAVITTDAMPAHAVGVVAETPVKARRIIFGHYYPQKVVFFDCFRCLGKARPNSRTGVYYCYYDALNRLDTKDC